MHDHQQKSYLLKRAQDSNQEQIVRMERSMIGSAVVEQSGAKIGGAATSAFAPLPNARLEMAREIVASYSFDPETGVSQFVVPAGITDVKAMRILNEYLRENLPGLKRSAVYPGDLQWYENLPVEFPEHCRERDYTHARRVTIHGTVKGIIDGAVVFADPRDQAIAAALHACTHSGFDLFVECKVRGSVPGFALYTDRISGVHVGRYDASASDAKVAASVSLG